MYVLYKGGPNKPHKHYVCVLVYNFRFNCIYIYYIHVYVVRVKQCHHVYHPPVIIITSMNLVTSR